MVERGYDHLFKFILIGDKEVGKTNISNRIVLEEFNEEYQPTIGVDFAVKYVTCNEKKIKCQLWDTTGDEKFRSIVGAYFRGASGILAVYDISKINTFEYVKDQLNCFKNHLFTDSIVLLIGNKSDLEDKRQVTRHEAQEYSRINGFLCVEVSAKTGKRVDDILYELVNEILCRKGERKIPKILRNSLSSISLSNEKIINTSTLPRLSASLSHRSSNLTDMRCNSYLLNSAFNSKNNEVENKKLFADVILLFFEYFQSHCLKLVKNLKKLIDQLKMLKDECDKKDNLILELNSIKYEF